VRELGFSAPTPVQIEAIPAALAGRDVLAVAPTGSGKTGAFGIPLIQMLRAEKQPGTRALVLAPTRELAAQIGAHLKALAKHTPIRVATIFGGVGFHQQATAFRNNTEIIVATPGRLLDLLAQNKASLARISFLVLDEVDRMLDMGFLPTVRRVLKLVPAKRQTLFFSATVPSDIKTLIAELLHDPVKVELGRQAGPPQVIEQTVFTVDGARKNDLLLELLKDGAIFSAIAFTRTKARANRLAALLEKNDVKVDKIHGDRSQAQRTRALNAFRSGKLRVLVATDIAARGIDVAGLGHVVNYDVPLVAEDYVHRVGRTGRMHAAGEAITFVSAEEERAFVQIERLLGRRLDRTKTPAAAMGPANAQHVHVSPVRQQSTRREGQRRRTPR
jgi:ATP-dependent RNA helicase RhlE